MYECSERAIVVSIRGAAFALNSIRAMRPARPVHEHIAHIG